MGRLSVVIADDDHLVLENLKTLVHWDNLGFQVVATAPNGKKALHYIEQYHPDVLITDIIMPIMNGLELIEHVRKDFPNMKILIISSYNEFEYAKKAIEKGVTDYILKTEVTAASFSAKLSSLFQQCTSQIQITSTALNQEFQSFLENDSETLEEEDYNSYPILSKVRNNFYQFFIMTQAIGFCKGIENTLDYWKKSIKFIYSSLQHMEELHTAPILFSHDNFCILGIPIESNRSNQLFLMKSLSKKILLYLNSRSPHDCVLFYSDNMITPIQLRLFMHKYQDALNFHAAFPITTGISFAEIKSNTYMYAVDDFPFQKLSFDKEHLENDVLQIKNHVIDCFNKKNYPAILYFFQNFCTHIEIVSNNYFHFNEQFFFQTIEMFLKWIFNAYEQCIIHLTAGQTQRLSISVQKAIHFIKQQYHKCDLSAEDISLHVALSIGRLGVLFKSETGKTINEYLTDIRIQNAIYFLSNTSMKIYEISEKCGYKSSQYFSQVFYQKTGKRPIEYRKIN